MEDSTVMPSYTMKDPEGVEHDMICTIADMEQKKKKGGRWFFIHPRIILLDILVML